jgi:hypothetical protein
MRLLAALLILAIVIPSSATPNARARLKRHAVSDKRIDALVSARSLVTYSDDGAADATVMDVGANAKGLVENPIPEVRAIVKLGAEAIPLLIKHLNDTRLTSAKFRGRSVPVGHVCLDILTNIVDAPKVLVKDCPDDGLGACVKSGYYFRPDAYSIKKNKFLAQPEIFRVKSNWQRTYQSGEIKFQYPKWWKPNA